MVVFFSNSEDAAGDARTHVLDELLVAHLAPARRIIQVHNLDRLVLGHRQIQLPHGVACARCRDAIDAARIGSKSREKPPTPS